MLSHWIFFICSGLIAYILISIFAQITGGSNPKNSWDAFWIGIQPLPVVIIVFSNLFFSLGVYHGFAITRFSIPMMVALGALTTFAYSLFVLGAQITLIKTLGILSVILGIALLSW